MKRLRGLCALPLICAAAPAPHPKIAVTIDDLPVHAPYPPGLTPLDVNRQMIAALKAAHVPVTAFVNAVNVKDAGAMEALREWRAAGFVLGNHSWSHPHLSSLSLKQIEQELTKDEPVLARLGGRSDWRWFRYPFLDEGKDEAQRIAVRRILASRGYRVAAVTTGFSDWAWTPAYARCSAKHDTAALAELERLYLRAVSQSIAADRENAQKLYGRDIAYVLLMHVSAMSAQMMPDVLKIYRDAGYRFVPLADAESDRAYAGYTHLELSPPPSSTQMASEHHVQLRPGPDYSAELNLICS